ncbi:hypothetical protein KKB55_02310 [Myxococcota bacterium]|nr:hypothetical protein [Myxococcota bacterium]
MREWMKAAAVALAAFGALFTGCAEERAPVDRVQPYALKKAYFVGDDLISTHDNPEFYYQGTLVDVGYGAAQDGLFTSTYAQPLSRIKWQITEEHLIGRIAYERIDGSDGKGVGGPVEDGIIAVVFRIQSHFDIGRQYSTATGEQMNVYYENNTDRPWNEREFFRVDFSQNLATDTYDFDTLSLLSVYGGIRYEPLAYNVTDPDDPDAPIFDLENGYFDVTNKAFAAPLEIDLSYLGWGIDSFPACFLPNDFMGGSEPAGTCNPVELTIRQSFKKVPKDDYEPAHWDGYRFQAFGAFYVDRRGYSRNYGILDSQWRRFISRYDIWQRSHYYNDSENMTGEVVCGTDETTPYGEDPNRDEYTLKPAAQGAGVEGAIALNQEWVHVPGEDGTEDECAMVKAITGVGGSRCDKFKNKCTLPFQLRQPKPVVWYYSTGSDPYYFEPTWEAVVQWDVALRMAVNSAKYAECKNTEGQKCENYPMHFGQQDNHQDLIFLAYEIEKCRAGMAYRAQIGYPQDKAGWDSMWAECNQLADSIGGQRGYDDQVIALAKWGQMIIVCHSPVEAGDHPACAPADKRLPVGLTAAACDEAMQDREHEHYETCHNAFQVRRGDLRYNQLNVLPDPQTPSPWGIMVDANDPLWGNVVSSSINVWAFVNDLWSQKVIDMMRFANGELSAEDIKTGKHIRDWSSSAIAASAGGVTSGMQKDELIQRLAAFSGAKAEEIREIQNNPQAVAPKIRAVAKELKREIKGIRAKWDAPSVMRPIYAARARNAYGSELEAQLMTPAMQQLMGIQGMPMGEGVMNVASILRGANPSFQRDLRQWKEIALAERGACILQEAPAPLSLTGLSDILEQKYGAFNVADAAQAQFDRAEKMRLYIARRAQTAVIVHEMGHSIGLRHNFVSSSDSFGYRPQYWQLRTNDGRITEECTEFTSNGTNCVGPRYFDPMTPNERNNMIWMWMHSSVMDYAGEPTQDMLGLAAYDFAAARMFYGQTVAVFADADLDLNNNEQSKAVHMLEKIDNFGGITGYTYGINGQETHYSQNNKNYRLIDECKEVDPSAFKPGSWNDGLQGLWSPVVDGLLVSNLEGKFTRCKQRKVDYVPWSALRTPTSLETRHTTGDTIFYRGGPSVDNRRRIRVPYGFGTDGWADLGNLSVYRHDNGADPYELFDFFISQQEVNHIFDNYRRDRSTFSVRSAAGRTLGRFNEKMRDGAKGLGLMANLYRMVARDSQIEFNSLWKYFAAEFFPANILASGIAFDHFARTLARPEDGNHYLDRTTDILRSDQDAFGNGTDRTMVIIPNGTTGYYEDVGIAGRPVENRLSENNGEYDSEFTENAGSYYDKIYAPMLMAESVDNFISDTRGDFVDPRYRSVAMGDLFKEGYRRWLANNLTGDDFIKGVRVASDERGRPLLDDERYPSTPLGWTTWWGEEPRVCFPNRGSIVCSNYADENSALYNPRAPEFVAVIDPQVGWEQQKFIIAMTLLYLPENEKQEWINSMRIWEMGVDSDPMMQNRIEFHHPSGKIYVARTQGKEQIFGKTVQKGIAARMLEYANEMLYLAYETEDGPDLDGDGEPDWYIPVFRDDGEPAVLYDPAVSLVDENGFGMDDPTCSRDDQSGCTCNHNQACQRLDDYVSLPFFMRQAMHAYGMVDPEPRGIY